MLFKSTATCFAVLKIDLPIGTRNLIVRSFASPLVYSLQKPYTYMVRMVAPYPKKCDFSFKVILSEKFPYMGETNVAFDDGVYTAEEELTNGYVMFCSEKGESKKSNKDNWGMWAWLSSGIAVVGIVVSIALWRKKGNRRE